jgi:hypothetical protein
VVLLLVREIYNAGGGAWRLYANGADLGTANLGDGTTFNDMQPGGSQGLEIGSSASLATRGVQGVTSLVHITRGKIPTTAEGRAITRNPWQLFRLPRRMFSIASPSGTPTLSAVTATDITSTTARLRVTVTF